MSKEVVIVTKIGKNYGALLQAFALKRAVEVMGMNVRIVNYALPPTLRTYDVLPKVTGITTLKAFIKSLKVYAATKRSVNKFLEFREEYFNFTEVYHNFTELNNNPPKADIYITGSDQVWNPCINFDPAYYLMFGNEDAIRVSYAASIGIDCIPDKYREEFCKRLSNITYKSVREDSAKTVLENLGIFSTVSLDPTLLHNRDVYDEIAIESNISRPYILLYLLIMPNDVKGYIDNLRKQYPNCILVNIPGSPTSKRIGDVEMRDIGPREFLGLVKNAKAVLTSSFHGTVFSIIYEKNFMSILPGKTGGRIEDLLCKLDIKERIAVTPANINDLDNKINYDDVNEKLSFLKEKSYDYLYEIKEQSKKYTEEN